MEDHIHVRSRGHLPHWERNQACYFVTFRLADSIPKQVLEKLESERQSVMRTAKQAGRELTVSEKHHIARFANLEKYLDQGFGACHLAKPQIAQIVAAAIQFFDTQRYSLFAWCVMPNHVHVVLRPFPGIELAAILHSWKSFSAKKINALLGAQGGFWEREYYDHLVRNEADLNRVVCYVAENPSKAGLKDWPWIWVGENLR